MGNAWSFAKTEQTRGERLQNLGEFDHKRLFRVGIAQIDISVDSQRRHSLGLDL